MAAQWHVGRSGQSTGPFPIERLREMAATGELSPGDLVWTEGMADWVDCATVGEIFPARRPPSAGAPASAGWNPYEAPSSDLPSVRTDGSASGPVQYADFLPRVGAAILDGIFLWLLTVVPVVLIAMVSLALFGQDNGAVIGQALGQIFGLIIGVAYYVGLETSEKQATWGKQIVGIKVTDLEGRRITVGRALGRYFAKILSGCTFGIGWLLPLFTEKKQTLHDMIAGCLAVKR